MARLMPPTTAPSLAEEQELFEALTVALLRRTVEPGELLKALAVRHPGPWALGVLGRLAAHGMPGDKPPRLAVASRLLRHTRLTVDEVARAVGYENAATFRGAFKRSRRMTPSRYREMHARDESQEDRLLAERIARPVLERIEQHGAELAPELRQVLQRIAAGLFRRADVAELVEGCGFSAAELSERFGHSFHRSPAAYVKRRRLEAAALLLRDTDWDVERIGALLSGSRSLSTFYRAFKEWAGCPPSVYRRRIVSSRPDADDE